MSTLKLFKDIHHQSKNFSRDHTPSVNFTNKSIDIFPIHISLSNYQTNPTSIKKRNIRTNSFGYFNTDTFTHGKTINKSKTKSKSKKKTPSTPNQFWKQFPKAKIPFRNPLKKVNSTNKLSCSIHDTNNQLNTLCESNTSDRQCTLSKEAKTKLINIYNEMYTLITSSSNEEEKTIIYEEIDKIYNSVKQNKDKSIIKEIEQLKEENRMIKETNNELLSRMSRIEKQCEMLSKDNERLKNEYKKSSIVLTEMKTSMKSMHSEISKIKKIENTSDFIATIVNDSSKRVNEHNDESSSDNVSLAENTNINETQKYPSTSMSSNITKPSSKLQLNLKNVTDFNDEFLENYSQFSPSWRKEADKMIMRRKANS